MCDNITSLGKIFPQQQGDMREQENLPAISFKFCLNSSRDNNKTMLNKSIYCLIKEALI